eukprot:TRINITY_DN597_c3_g1_i2.p1 TRINITY_DN597_c3_g1~~TRINITY_DN597_c3_g1_i2.p1  ORF type:complete len:595 (+),score=238.12 TRINITY_DN597_c3_g1_i2:188-1972(+)
MQFAMIEATIVLVTLLKYKYIRLSEKSNVHEESVLTVRPGGLYLKFSDRIRESCTTNSRTSTSTSSSSTPTSSTKKTKDVVDKSNPNSSSSHNLKIAPVTFVYGSNTGTTQDYANRIAENLESQGLPVGCFYSLDEFVSIIQKDGGSSGSGSGGGVKKSHPYVVFLTATYNGLPPDNARVFDTFISSSENESKKPFDGVKYAVFGVGNSQWVTFQAFPRKIANRVKILGGEILLSPGEIDMDDTSNVEEIVMKFEHELIGSICSSCSGNKKSENLRSSLSSSSSSSSSRGGNYDVKVVNEKSQSVLLPSSNAQVWKLKSRKDLQSSSSDRHTTHMEFSLPSNEKLSFITGDHFGVYPGNSSRVVQYVANRLKINLSDVIIISNKDNALSPSSSRRQRISTLPIDKPVSVGELFTYWIDLQSTPTRVALSQIASFAKDDKEKERITLFSSNSAEGLNEYKNYFVSSRKTFVDLINDFTSITDIPFNVILEVLPRLQPRFYSISSSPRVSQHSLTLTVGKLEEELSGVIDEKTKKPKVYVGVCSSYLTELKEGSEVYAFIPELSTKFRLTENPEKPIIMICSGTGYAPFRGFLQGM